jgi:hypothetical protein
MGQEAFPRCEIHHSQAAGRDYPLPEDRVKRVIARRHDGRPAWQDAPERLRASAIKRPEPAAKPGILQRILRRIAL